MDEGKARSRPSRLGEVEEMSLEPFVRAQALTDVSVYWVPVSQFPVLPRQREWIGEFHTRLAKRLRETDELREEVFLQFKALYPDLIDRFTDTGSQFLPVTGMSLAPRMEPAPRPDLESVRKQVEDAQKQGTGVDTGRWTPDYLHWFARKRPREQREHFLGYGGMLTLYIAPDPATAAPVVEMPGFVKKLNVYDARMQDDIQAAYSFRDAFLTRSKEAFGGAFREDPAYRGMAFILPLLTGASLVAATQNERAAWFDVFYGYFAESRPDSGMVLAVKDPEFDETLMKLLREMRDDGLVYRQ